MNISVSECADYADHPLLSEINLRDLRFLITNYSIKEMPFHDSTNKICEICGNPMS